MENKICKHTKPKFDISEQMDIVNNVPHSFLGIWTECEMICTLFDTQDEQFKKNQGFLFCDKTRKEKCIFYEPSKLNKKVIQEGIIGDRVIEKIQKILRDHGHKEEIVLPINLD